MERSSSSTTLNQNLKASRSTFMTLPSVSNTADIRSLASQEKSKLGRHSVSSFKKITDPKTSYTKQYYVDEEIDKLLKPKGRGFSTSRSKISPTFSNFQLQINRRRGLRQEDYIAINKLRDKYITQNCKQRKSLKTQRGHLESRVISMRDIKITRPKPKSKQAQNRFKPNVNTDIQNIKECIMSSKLKCQDVSISEQTQKVNLQIEEILHAGNHQAHNYTENTNGVICISKYLSKFKYTTKDIKNEIQSLNNKLNLVLASKAAKI